MELGDDYEILDVSFDVAPAPRSIRDEANAYGIETMLQESIDNAIRATAAQNRPVIALRLRHADTDNPILEWEDNGCGMSLKMMETYLVLGSTTSSVPPLQRDEGVLPFHKYINMALGRFGRGCVAGYAWGGVIEISSEEEVQTELDVGCRVSYRVRVDYDAMCEDEKRGVPRTEIYRKHVVVGRTLIVDDAGSHGTIFRISKLRPELLEQLRNSSFLASLGRELNHVYHFFVHGFPAGVWIKLPRRATHGLPAPKGGLRIEFFKDLPGGCVIAKQAMGGTCPKSDMQLGLEAIERQLQADPRLRVAVVDMRFAPAGVLPPGCPPPPPHARSATPGGGAGEDGANTGPRGSGGTQRGRKGPQAKGTSKGRKRARDEADKEAPSGRGDPGAGPSNAVAVPRSSEAAGACGGQGAPAGAAREAGQQSARVCDLMFLHVYYPHKSSARTKPRASAEGLEWHLMPHWSGKALVKDEMKRTYPPYVHLAADIAKDTNGTKILAPRLADRTRLTVIMLASPDMEIHHHKALFHQEKGSAYYALMYPEPVQADGSCLPRGLQEPRLYTYIPDRSEQQRRADTAAANDLLALAAGHGQDGPGTSAAGGTKQAEGGGKRQVPVRGGSVGGGRSRSKAGRSGGGGAEDDSDAESDGGWNGDVGDEVLRGLQPGWHEDSGGVLAARLLVEAFGTWQQLDEAGSLAGELEDEELLTVRQPHNIPVNELGRVTRGTAYSLGPGYQDLRIDELVRYGPLEEAAGRSEDDDSAGTVGSRITLCSTFIFEGAFMAHGQTWGIVRPWRPAHAPPAVATFMHMYGVKPLAAMDKAKTYAERQQLQRAKEAEWNRALPHHVSFTDARALRDSYDIAQLLEVLAFGLDLRPAPEPEQPPQGAAGGGGGRRRSKAAARNGQPTETDMPTVRLKFKGYMAVAVVKLQRLLEDGATLDMSQEAQVFGQRKYFKQPRVSFDLRGVLSELVPYRRYRLTVVCEEQGPQLMAAAREHRELQHDFMVKPNPPTALRAFFDVAPSPAAGAEAAAVPIVRRLGVALPDLVIELLDAAGGKVQFDHETVQHLAGRAPGLGSSSAAAGAAGGPDGVDQLPTVHAVNVDNARSLMALQREAGGRQAAAAGGGGGGGARISFSADRMQLRISGLAVRPQKLYLREDDKPVQTASVGAQLDVSLPWGPATTLRPLHNEPPPAFTLRSGELHTLVKAGWFDPQHSTKEKPVMVGKGNRPRADFRLPLRDANDNPYSSMAGDPPLRVKLHAQGYGANGRPPVAASSGPAVRIRTGARGEAEVVVPAARLVATGVPGDSGSLQLQVQVRRQQQQQPVHPAAQGRGGGAAATGGAEEWCTTKQLQLEAFVSVLEVYCVVMRPEAEAQDQHGAGGTARGMLPHEGPQLRDSYVEELCVDGSKSAVVNLRRGFQRLRRFTSSGVEDMYLRPMGGELLTHAQAEGFGLGAKRKMEQCFLIHHLAGGNSAAAGPAATGSGAGGGAGRGGAGGGGGGGPTGVLRGLVVALREERDGKPDKAFTAQIQVLIGGRRVGEATASEAVAHLPDLMFTPTDFEVDGDSSGTAVVTLLDAHAGYEYGRFYVRQVPSPAAMRLAPADCELLREAEATAAPPVGSAAAPVTGRLMRRQGAPEGSLLLLKATGTARHAPEVDGAELVARGFELSRARPLRVRRGGEVRVPLVLVDGMGLPIAPNERQLQQLQQHLRASLVRDQGGGGGGSGAHGAAGGRSSGRGAAAGVEHQEDGTDGEPRCDVVDWEWPAEGGGQLQTAPICFVRFRISSGRGPGTIRLSYDPLAAVAAEAEAEAEAEADQSAEAGGGWGDWVPPLDLAVPVTITSGPLAPGGYRVSSRTHEALHVDVDNEDPAANAALTQLLRGRALPEGCSSCYRVLCRQRSELQDLVVELRDSNGVRLTHDVSFTLEATAPLHIGAEGDQDEQQQQQQQQPHRKRQRKEPTVTSSDGRLEVPALAVGRGPAWWRQPLLLTLHPQAQDDAVVDGAAGPLVIVVQVEPHSYPRGIQLDFPEGAVPQDLIRLDNPQDGGSRVPHPSQRSQAGGEAQEAGDAPADPGAPLPLAFMVRLLAPDGGHGLDPALMEPLQLRFSRQIQGEDAWEHYTDLPVQYLQATAQPAEGTAGTSTAAAADSHVVYEAAAGQLHMPAVAGAAWRLEALYEEPGGPSAAAAAASLRPPLPLLVAEFAIGPAPPVRMALDGEVWAELGLDVDDERQREQQLQQQRQQPVHVRLGDPEAQQQLVPSGQVKGSLLDGWGNGAPGAPAPLLGVVARPVGTPGGGAPAVLLSQPARADEQSGRFELPPCGGLALQVEGSAQSLQPGIDYMLRVEMLGPDGKPQEEQQQQPVKGGRKQGKNSTSTSSKGGRTKGGSKRKRRGAEVDAADGDGGDGAGPSGGAGAEEQQQYGAIPPVTLRFVHVLPPVEQPQQPLLPVPALGELVPADDDSRPAVRDGEGGPEPLAEAEAAADAGGVQIGGGAGAAARLAPLGAAAAAAPLAAGGEGVPEPNQQLVQLQVEQQAAEGEPEWREHEQQEEEEEEEPVHARVRQPVVPTELTLAGEVALPPGGRITLSNPNPAQGPAADGEGNGEGAAPVLPCLPAALAVIALGTEGEPVPAEDLRPLQLHYERQDLAGGPWRRDDSVQPPPVQPTAAAGHRHLHEEDEEDAGAAAQYTAAAGTVSMPTNASPARWRLVATYPLPEHAPGPAGVEGGGAVQVLQLPLVEFILAPAPAVRLRLDAASTQAAAGVLGPAGRLLLVIREGLGDKELPELRGGLVDGWGNAAPPSHPTAVELTWRPSVPTAPATHGAQRPVLCSGHVDPADGSFALPGYPLSGANLPEHVDLDLVLRLVGQGQQQGGGEALEQPGALGAVPQLMLQRVYVASRELSALRAELESINKELEELKDEEDSAKDALQQLRNRLDEARATLAEVQQQLQEQGVATPHGGSAEEGAVLQQLVASINTRAQEVHEGLQRQHDAVRAFLGQPPAHYVPLQGRQETVQVVQRLVKAFGSWPGVLGPLCTMCAVEDPRVAKLLWFLRVDLTCMLVVGESVKVAVRRALNAREDEFGEVYVVDITSPRLYSKYDTRTDATRADDPQARMLPSNKRNTLLGAMPREVQERGGFLGFMSDLIHLRPQYQPPQLTVPLELRQVVYASLRQTVLHMELRDTMLFSTGEDILAYTSQPQLKRTQLPRMVALDGLMSYNFKGKDELGPPLKLQSVGAWLSGVPVDQVIAPLPQLGGPAGNAAGAGQAQGQGQGQGQQGQGQGGARGEALDGRLRELQVRYKETYAQYDALLDLRQQLTQAATQVVAQRSSLRDAESRDEEAARGRAEAREEQERQRDEVKEKLQALEEKEREREAAAGGGGTGQVGGGRRFGQRARRSGAARGAG